MCGICGVFRPDGGEVDWLRVQRMREAIAYRGPDASGMTQSGGCALGHQRLSIIDLSQRGLQPMKNEDSSVEVVFNGEIYNFKELKHLLETEGHAFQSTTDTETLVHGYEEWGIAGLLSRIKGMYALAIFDQKEHCIHLARDPLGKKPLFFCYDGEELVFASSARALALGLHSTPSINVSAVDDFLWNLFVSGPETIFSGVEKLPPGHSITIRRDGSRRDSVHWQADFLSPEEGTNQDEWLERIEELLEMAVQRRLVADVPIGLLLSGGVDSSLITAIASKLCPGLQTFSVASEDPALDESGFAHSVAERCGTKHHKLEVRGEIRNSLPQLIAAMGEPLADASAINTFAISRAAKEYVKVVLTGDGGDEGFGGYRQFLAYYVAGKLSRLGSSFLKLPKWILDRAQPNGTGRMHSAQTLLRLASEPLEQTLFAQGMAMDRATRSALYTSEFYDALGTHCPDQHFRKAVPVDEKALPVDRVMQARIKTVLPDDYLTKVDNATMAVGLEARSPFLDVDVINLAMRIPAAIRFGNAKPKALLQRLAMRYVPASCVKRRKQGFVAPVGKWIRNDWPDLVEDLVLGDNIERRGWFRRDTLERVVGEHRAGADHGYLLWGIMVLELWTRMSIDHTLSATDRI
ncbi:MAG: asnB [Acidobacteriales bacterium]|nr:asnB [Terriglobales bacterium]